MPQARRAGLPMEQTRLCRGCGREVRAGTKKPPRRWRRFSQQVGFNKSKPLLLVSREATAGFEPAMGVLQTPALPLGYVALRIQVDYQASAEMSNRCRFARVYVMLWSRNRCRRAAAGDDMARALGPCAGDALIAPFLQSSPRLARDLTATVKVVCDDGVLRLARDLTAGAGKISWQCSGGGADTLLHRVQREARPIYPAGARRATKGCARWSKKSRLITVAVHSTMTAYPFSPVSAVASWGVPMK